MARMNFSRMIGNQAVPFVEALPLSVVGKLRRL